MRYEERARRGTRQDEEPEARLRWARGADWQPAVHAVYDSGERGVSWFAIIMGLAFAVLATLLLNGCPTPQPQPHSPVFDASNTTPCDQACSHLAELGCKEALPTKQGTTCEQVCRNAVNEGQPLNTDCVATITACDQLQTVCR